MSKDLKAGIQALESEYERLRSDKIDSQLIIRRLGLENGCMELCLQPPGDKPVRGSRKKLPPFRIYTVGFANAS